MSSTYGGRVMDDDSGASGATRLRTTAERKAVGSGGWTSGAARSRVPVARLLTFGGRLSVCALAATLLLAVQIAIWASMTPQFRAPDESQHINSILRVANGGGWPKPGDAVLSEEIVRARTLAGLTAGDGTIGLWNGATLLPGARSQQAPEALPGFVPFSSRTPATMDQRQPFDRLKATQDYGPHLDQMTQHPPGYYGLMAGVYLLVNADNWRFDRAIFLLRIASGALVCVVPGCAFLVARRLTGSTAAGNLASLIPLGIPQFAFIGGSVTNDALATGLAAIGIVQVVWLATGQVTWRRILLAGVTFGGIGLVKATALTLVPLLPLSVVLGLLVHARTTHNRFPVRRCIGMCAASGFVALISGCWWWGLNLVRYGVLQPAAYTLPPRDFEPIGVIPFAGEFLLRVGQTFTGTFGMLELPLDPRLTVAVTSVLIILMIIAVVRYRRSPVAWILLSAFLLPLGGLFITVYQGYTATGHMAGLQGRYLFVSMVAIAGLASAGVHTVVVAARVSMRLALPVIWSGLCGLSVWGLWTAFNGQYREASVGVGDGLRIMIGWSPWSARIFVVMGVVAAGLTVTVLFLLAARGGVSRPAAALTAAPSGRASADARPNPAHAPTNP
jgi:hypothetical protein